MRRAFVIYGQVSGIVRRVVVSDNDQFNINNHITPGETFTGVGSLPDTVGVDAVSVMQAIGVTSPSERCAIVSSNNLVVGVIAADPILDQPPVPGAALILSSNAQIGWSRSSGVFIPPAGPPSSAVGSSSNVPGSSASSGIGLGIGR